MTNISSVDRDKGLSVVKSLDRSLLYISFTAYLNIFLLRSLLFLSILHYNQNI